MEAKVKIFGEEYPLRINSEEGLERLEKVALYVDRKMREVSSSYVNLSAKQVAVLAALNIADEFITFQKTALDSVADSTVLEPQPDNSGKADNREKDEDKIAGLLAKIDRVIGQAAG